MEDKIYAIGMTMAHSAEKLLHDEDGAKCFAVMAAPVYTAHVKPLEDALAHMERALDWLAHAAGFLCDNAVCSDDCPFSAVGACSTGIGFKHFYEAALDATKDSQNDE